MTDFITAKAEPLRGPVFAEKREKNEEESVLSMKKPGG
jgi:hypothetical protein